MTLLACKQLLSIYYNVPCAGERYALENTTELQRMNSHIDYTLFLGQ
jgi:hypothetical protein